MQVNETVAEGLRRELEVIIPAAEMSGKLDSYLNDMKTRMRINGFRPGKVPVSHLKKVYGRRAMAEVLNETVAETVRATLEERDEKPAMQPEVDLSEEVARSVVEGSADLQFKLQYDVLPTFELGDFTKLNLERPTLEISDEEIDEEVKSLAENNRPFVDKDKGAEAVDGDQVTIDFVGRIDGEAFDGGTGEDVPLVIGSGRFIPGFEEQLIGAKVDDTLTVSVTFPEDYHVTELAGKAAEFETTVKDIAEIGEVTIDDAFAATLGIEDLEKLKELLRFRIQEKYSQASRRVVKRKLLDRLDEEYSFDLPQRLVDSEFDISWRQLLADMEKDDKSFDDEEANEDKTRADYMLAAERRVRLGLLLAAIGEKNGVQVSEDEINRALYEQARRFPGQQREVFEYYKSNPQARAALGDPIYEEKVIDYILELAQVTNVPMSKDELLALDASVAFDKSGDDI